MQSSTGTLTVRVCTCDRDGNMELCNPEALSSSAGISTGALIAILLCAIILLSEYCRNAAAYWCTAPSTVVLQPKSVSGCSCNSVGVRAAELLCFNELMVFFIPAESRVHREYCTSPSQYHIYFTHTPDWPVQVKIMVPVTCLLLTPDLKNLIRTLGTWRRLGFNTQQKKRVKNAS